MGEKKHGFFNVISEKIQEFKKEVPNTEFIKESNVLSYKTLNRKYQSHLVVNVDWGILPENIDQWKMKRSEMKKGMFALYYYPIHEAFDLIKNKVNDFKSIPPQITSIELMPNKKPGYTIGFKNGSLYLLKSYTADFSNPHQIAKAKKTGEALADMILQNTVHTFKSNL